MNKGQIIEYVDGRLVSRQETDEEFQERQELRRLREEEAQQREELKQQQQQRKQRLDIVRDEVKNISLDPEDLGEVVDVLRTVVKVVKLLQLEIADLREPVISDLG